MNALLIYPECPETFWSFKHALKFISRKASGPPLGLLTVAAMLPVDWNLKLVDLNTHILRESDLEWADLALISAMSIQRASVKDILIRCKQHFIPVVGGGPLFTACFEEYEDVDYLVLGEAELTLPQFLADYQSASPKHIYKSEGWADIRQAPIPRWDLIKSSSYAQMNIQYSRGCPFDCSFCDIMVLFGDKPRTKAPEQLITELEALYRTGWKGSVFFVDDNFIGNKKSLKQDVLPLLTNWMQTHGNPFTFITECTLNLSDDEELMQAMVKSGFEMVFIGIESPCEESLAECGKVANRNRDMIASIRRIQNSGLVVTGGFIVGFDSDPLSIFDIQTRFIQDSGIVTAMVGLLNAPVGTKLYKRIAAEGRLLNNMSGDNTDYSINFIPKMDITTLQNGYRNLLKNIYSPRNFYARLKRCMQSLSPSPVKHPLPRMNEINALFASMFRLGIIGKESWYYWKMFFWSLFTHPRLFKHAITMSIYGYHFRMWLAHQTRTWNLSVINAKV